MLYTEIFLIAISLSMDAFSLAIGISSLKLNHRIYITNAILVGLFHFFMPILGFYSKKVINNVYKVPGDVIFICVIIFIIIGIIFDREKNITKKILNPIIFAFTVSIDSYSIGLSIIKQEMVISCIIFSIVSFLFTISGFLFGEYISKKFHHYSKLISIFLLSLVLIFKFIKV